uniref:Uncharacterized protein n=1 Tax=Hyaloperonospora arabidopsidis (strain Emoy2) TaxID=559515 RepID=M4B343_HYAAE
MCGRRDDSIRRSSERQKIYIVATLLDPCQKHRLQNFGILNECLAQGLEELKKYMMRNQNDPYADNFNLEDLVNVKFDKYTGYKESRNITTVGPKGECFSDWAQHCAYDASIKQNHFIQDNTLR